MNLDEQRPRWQDKNRRKQMLDPEIKRRKTATFGFSKVAEEDKVVWVRRHFDSVARNYDFMNTLLSFGIHLAWKRSAIRQLRLKPGQRILDVCGGTGDLSVMAQRTVDPGGQVTLYDINYAMIDTGRHTDNHTRIRSRISYVQGDAEKIAFPDECFDAVMVGFGIRNVTHMIQGFREMVRVLKPGGQLLCLEFSKPTMPLFRWLYDFYSFHIMPWLGEVLAGSRQAYTHLPETIRLFPLPEELARILEDIGLTDIRYRRLTNGIAVIHTGRKL